MHGRQQGAGRPSRPRRPSAVTPGGRPGPRKSRGDADPLPSLPLLARPSARPAAWLVRRRASSNTCPGQSRRRPHSPAASSGRGPSRGRCHWAQQVPGPCAQAEPPTPCNRTVVPVPLQGPDVPWLANSHGDSARALRGRRGLPDGLARTPPWQTSLRSTLSVSLGWWACRGTQPPLRRDPCSPGPSHGGHSSP